VSGDGESSCPEDSFCDFGVDNAAGHSGVRIKHGSVRAFDVAVFSSGGSENRIDSLATAQSTTVGIVVRDSAATRVDHNSSDGDGVFGIFMVDSHDARIDHNFVTGTRGYSIPVFGSTRVRVSGNVLESNGHGVALDGADDNDVVSNRISHTSGSSIDFGGSGNRIVDNVVTDSGDGIVGGGVHNVISDNTVARIGFFGFPDTGGFGLLIDGGHDDLLQGNSVTDTRGPAIYVAQLDSPDGAAHTTVTHNVANSRLGDGIHVDAGATATLLEANAADGSGDDGIDVESATTTLTGNTANDNRDLGIKAVPGVSDGGANTASGNGNPLQCTNLACS
jgi:parallel beta-helix repeat protein